MTYTSVNGQRNPSVSALDRGLAFGDGVFETVRLHKGQLPLWSYHRDRLEEGCQRLHIPLNIQAVETWLHELISTISDVDVSGVVKVIVTRGAGGRGYGIDPAMTPTVVCSLHPALKPSPEQLLSKQSVEMYLCQQPLSVNPALAGIKHLNRLENVLLKAECQQAGFEDGLVVDAGGHIVESTSSNVFFERDGQFYTPSLDGCGVRGVMRRFLLDEILPELQLDAHVTSIPLQDLPSFQSAFLCNSIRGVVPILRINKVEFVPSSLITRLTMAIEQSRFIS